MPPVKITDIVNGSDVAYANIGELLSDLKGFFDKASSNIGGLLGTLSYSASAPTPSKSGYYFFTDTGVVTYLNKNVKAGDVLVITYNDVSNINIQKSFVI